MKPAVLILLVVLSGVAVSAGLALVQQTDWWLGSDELSQLLNPRPSPAIAEKVTAAAQAAATAVVDEPEYDFGQAKNHTTGLRHAFQVRNNGTAPLKIISATASCPKCTYFDLPPDPIPAGGSAEVVVRWDIESVEDSFRQSVTIHTNDPNTPDIRLGLTGKIVQLIDAVPKELVFSRIALDEPAEAHARLYANLNDDLRIAGQEMADQTTSSYFEVKSTRLDPSELPQGVRSGIDLTVTVKPGLPAGAFEQTIELKTNVPDAADVKVPIRGTIINGITVVGPEWDSERGILLLGLVDRSRGAKRTLKLIVRGQHRHDLEFEQPRIDPELIKVTVHNDQKTESNQGAVVMVPVTIEIPAGSAPVSRMGGPQGPFAEVILPTNQPKVGSVKLRVRFAVIDR